MCALGIESRLHPLSRRVLTGDKSCSTYVIYVRLAGAAGTDVTMATESDLRLPRSEALSLRQWFSRAQQGQPLVILCLGAVGTGKSTLCRVAADEGTKRGFEIATVRTDLDGAHVESFDMLDGSRPSLGLDRLLNQARLNDERWLLLLDDAHTQDPDAVAAVAHQVATSRARVLLLLTAVAGGLGSASSRTAALSANLAAEGTAVTMNLGPWSGVDVNEFLRDHLTEASATLRFGFELARITGGNPTLIRAYAEAIVAMPPDERLPLLTGACRLIDLSPPTRARQLVNGRIAEVEGNTRRVLQVLALWGLPATSETLADLGALDTSELEHGLDELEDAGHVRSTTTGRVTMFTLPDLLTARVVAEGAPALLTRRVHARASMLLAEASVEPGQLVARAEHHLKSRPLDAARARQVIEAAQLLLSRGRHVSARELLEVVISDSIEEDLPSPVLASAAQALAEAYARAGQTRIAERLVQATRVRGDGVDGAYLRALYGLARGWLSVGRELEAEASLRYLVAHPQTPRTARFAATAQLVRLNHWAGHPEKAVATATQGRERHDGEPDALAELWLQQALVSHMDGRPEAAREEARRSFWLAREIHDDSIASRALVTIGDSLLDTDSVTRALTWLRGGVRRAEESQSVDDVAWIRNRLIPAYLEAGQWDYALTSARRGISQAASINLPHTLRRSRAAIALVDALRGDASEEWLQTRLTSTDFGNPFLLTAVATTLFEQQRTARRADQAHNTIALATEALVERRGWIRFLALELLPRLGRSLDERGDTDGLREVVTRLSHMAEERPELAIARVELLVAEARLALLEGRVDDAVPKIERARMAYESLAFDWRWADSGGLLARAYVAAGRKTSAIEVLRSSVRRLDSFGARPAAEAQRTQLHGIGGRAPRTRTSQEGRLTQRQMEVARLAARGFTDRAIAEELGMTFRTATTHMHTILRNLKLHSRQELAEWLARA